ncbi:APA family fibronectin-binding glycoprotein [Rhodococcus sp. IEGM 1408]|uniref:APA family fibronectin-binding glycoprotein n=1 Tax=Rhodococcus sp. IEGM 1408 TaxID=3082220 RepID=UPI002952AF16|nr:APA family fibronectin-binding glycoprotein [Rhodococcus sp. IEGM 1408]MDV7999746.1 APA family fibronectin-binding glycoprotein [Rhodococcus sp. IEGM 1408]
MTSGQNPSAGTSRTILLVALVALLAVVAAVVTVLVSSATYSPGVRTLSPKTQVAAGTDLVDPYAGLVVRVPEGWRAESGDLVFGTTVLTPVEAVEEAEAEEAAADRSDGVVLVGQLTDELFDLRNPDNQQAAFALASGMGQILLPVPGRPSDESMEPISTRVGDGWAVSFRVLPAVQQGLIGPEGALVYSAVVGEGAQRYWLTYIGLPGDGTVSSPHADWADEIVERLRPAEASYAPLGPGEEPV